MDSDITFKVPTLISVKLSNDSEIQELNEKYFGRKYPTDVLSFNMEDSQKDDHYLGDIIVNVDQAKRQAKKYNNDLKHEIAQLVEHGVLHLLGVHHDGDDENHRHNNPIN